MSTSTTTSGASTATREAVLKALARGGDMTAAQVADAAGIGRSTATRFLAALTVDGQLARTLGGRDGARRLPDRWTLVATPKVTSSRARARKRAAITVASTATGARLRSGELAGQVLGYLREHPGQHSPTAIAAGLGGRSGGAVSNALARLSERGEATLTQDRARRYTAVNA
jgi:DNA-binding MarR family transcriptional regulator